MSSCLATWTKSRLLGQVTAHPVVGSPTHIVNDKGRTFSLSAADLLDQITVLTIAGTLANRRLLVRQMCLIRMLGLERLGGEWQDGTRLLP